MLVFNHGGQNDVSINVLTGNGFSDGCLRDFFVLVPSFRGEELGTGELGLGNLISEGEARDLDAGAGGCVPKLGLAEVNFVDEFREVVGVGCES